MGGLNSVSNITKNFNTVITQTTLNVLQNSSTKISQSQVLDVDCTEFQKTKAKFMNDCQQRIEKLIDKGEASIADLKSSCDIFGSCGADQVSLNGVLQANLSSSMISDVSQKIQKDLSSKITQSAKQSTGIGQFGVKTKNELDTFTKTVSDLIENFLQNLDSNSDAIQTIVVKDGQVSMISFDMFTNILQKKVLENSTYVQGIQNVKNVAEQDAENKSGSDSKLVKVIVIIAGSIIGFMIALGVVLAILKKSDKQKVNSQ